MFNLAYGIKYICCGFTNVFRHLRDSMGQKLRKTIHAPFKKCNYFNNFRKELTFGADWVDSLLNTFQTLYNIFYNGR